MPDNQVTVDPATGAGNVVGPLTDTAQHAFSMVWETAADNLPSDLHWRIILLTLVLATLIWLLRSGHGARGADGRERKASLLQFLLPSDIYTHVSARVDIWLWVTERILRPFWAVGLFATVGPLTEKGVIQSLEWTFGATVGNCSR